MITLIHCADLHLGGSFCGIDSSKAKVRNGETEKSFSKIVDDVLNCNASIFFIAGDLFDSPYPPLSLVKFVSNELKRVNIPVFISPGNHDFLCSQSYYLSGIFPDNVHIFSKETECIDFPELNVSVYGFGFCARQQNSMLSGFHVRDESRINLMCIHGDTNQSDYNYISKDDISLSGLDYLALGHIHSFSGVLKSGQTSYAYPGTHDGHGFDECSTKGYLKVNVSKSEIKAEFIETSSRVYNDISFDVSSFLSSQEICEKISPLLSQNDLYKIRLLGEISEDIFINIPYIREELSKKAFFVKVKDETKIKTDIEYLLNSKSTSGYFARALKKQNLDEETFYKALKYGLNALSGKEALK